MQIDVPNAILQTYYFILVLVLVLLITVGKKNNQQLNLSISTANQIKGFAILSVVLSHIGYFLVSDHQYLFPLSVLAGVGVNIFLVFSGYGLTQSTFKKSLGLWDFYKRRLQRIYIPMWVVLSILLVAEWLILGHNYSWKIIGQSYLGYFPRPDLYKELNSPLWYFTFIAMYYLIFPIVTKIPFSYVWPILVWWLSTHLIKFSSDVDLQKLYESHLLAFPLGITTAIIQQKLPLITEKIKFRLPLIFNWLIKGLGVIFFSYLIGYTAINSGVGQGIEIEQQISLITTLCIIALFILLPVNLGFLELYGIYSYEIYLIHWPLMYRFDIFFRFLPAWLATILYVVLFLGLGFIIKILIDKIIDRSQKLPSS